jgi:hypothetical protein
MYLRLAGARNPLLHQDRPQARGRHAPQTSGRIHPPMPLFCGIADLQNERQTFANGVSELILCGSAAG